MVDQSTVTVASTSAPESASTPAMPYAPMFVQLQDQLSVILSCMSQQHDRLVQKLDVLEEAVYQINTSQSTAQIGTTVIQEWHQGSRQTTPHQQRASASPQRRSLIGRLSRQTTPYQQNLPGSPQSRSSSLASTQSRSCSLASTQSQSSSLASTQSGSSSLTSSQIGSSSSDMSFTGIDTSTPRPLRERSLGSE